jgi:hypothetical protein
MKTYLTILIITGIVMLGLSVGVAYGFHIWLNVEFLDTLIIIFGFLGIKKAAELIFGVIFKTS